MEFWLGIRRHIRRRMNAAPTKPPYRVEVFNPTHPSYYVSGMACNVCVGVYCDRDMAERVAGLCNRIAERYS